MDNKLQEKRIIKSIFLIPIFSLILFAILIFTILSIYFNNFQQNRIIEYKNTILNERKNETKDMLFSLVQDINHDIKDLHINIKKELKDRIDEAENIINRIIKNNPDKSPKEIKELIKQILGAIRYNNGRGYYFAYDEDTKISIIHPLKKFQNRDMSNFKDIRGTYLVKFMDKKLQNKNSAYATIYFAKPNNPNKEFKKIVYLRYIPKLNWVIGTGEYVDDATNELKNELLEEIKNKKYGQNGYFWVHSIDYTLLSHPYRKQDIGKNDKNLTDIKGEYIIQKFIQTALNHSNGCFVEYFWKNPTTKKVEKKISFVYYIPYFKWIIGTGLYTEDLNGIIENRAKIIQEKIKNLLLVLVVVLIIITSIIAFISYILSKHTQKIFEMYKNDLENKIQKAVDENTKKDMILQQQSKLAAMGEMISAIAHQWRQPLNSLALNIQLLVDDFFDKKVDEKYIENFEKKQLDTIKFMSNTIDDFRNFFSKDTKKEKFSVKEAINDVISLLNAQLKNHNIEIEIIGKDFYINSYKNQFKQVILNIINNAKDSIIETKKGGKITIILNNNQIIIKDTGKNIPKEIQNRLFEPYFTTKEKGTGIGLYMSKMIIEKLGGNLEYISPKQFIIKGFK